MRSQMRVTTIVALSCVAAHGTAFAQQPTSTPAPTPGSPSVTTIIDGKQLPPPDPKFGGVIKENAAQSKAWWAPRVVPPQGAPNILLIITDDAGFGVPSTFGGVIPTPAMDRVANNGLRYNNIHSTALCSPTRAALITGHRQAQQAHDQDRPAAVDARRHQEARSRHAKQQGQRMTGL